MPNYPAPVDPVLVSAILALHFSRNFVQVAARDANFCRPVTPRHARHWQPKQENPPRITTSGSVLSGAKVRKLLIVMQLAFCQLPAIHAAVGTLPNIGSFNILGARAASRRGGDGSDGNKHMNSHAASLFVVTIGVHKFLIRATARAQAELKGGTHGKP